MLLLGFDYPADLYYWLSRDMWVRPLPDEQMQIGVTTFGVRLSGSFFMCRPKAVGTALRQGDTVAVVELSKSIVAVKTPVSGVVTQVNPLLEDTPEVIHQQPYGDGWLVTLQLTHWDEDLAQLHHADNLTDAAIRRMRLENLDFSGSAP